MAQRTPTERTVQYATTVDNLIDAWAFVMDHVDEVGTDPRITISPITTMSWDGVGDEPPTRGFEVAVSGMTEQP